jgi:hypothetical protein
MDVIEEVKKVLGEPTEVTVLNEITVGIWIKANINIAVIFQETCPDEMVN